MKLHHYESPKLSLYTIAKRKEQGSVTSLAIYGILFLDCECCIAQIKMPSPQIQETFLINKLL